MGTFSEVVLCFSFRPDTPDHVLSAFSALAIPQATPFGDTPAPALPPPYAAPEDDDWLPDTEDYDPDADAEPWAHDWARWFRSGMSVSTAPSAQLTWQASRWTVTCRWSIKTWPEAVLPCLRWLGPHLKSHALRPLLLGYIEYGDSVRPTLVWLGSDGQITGEDLDDSSR
jgi:hypothetical protein